MALRFFMRPIVAIAGVAAGLTAGAGVAYAEPALDSVANTSCTYTQAITALETQSPETAQEFYSAPGANAWLQGFLASPVDKRRQMLQQVQSLPGAQQYIPLVLQIASTCNNF
jgi:hemophore-related protein